MMRMSVEEEESAKGRKKERFFLLCWCVGGPSSAARVQESANAAEEAPLIRERLKTIKGRW